MSKISNKIKNLTKPMPMVRIRRFAQITLPTAFRNQFNLAEGDYLQVEENSQGILLKPVRTVDKKAAWSRLIGILNKDKSTPLSRKQTDLEAEEEIMQIVKENRKLHG